MSLVRRLAGSCARGWRQRGLVNEILVSPAPIKYKYLGGKEFVLYGDSEVQGSSYRNLRRRLVAVGFVLHQDPHACTLTMTFPEEES